MPLPHISPVSRRLIPLLLAVVLSAFLVQTTQTTASAAPGDPVGCGYGTGGANASTICWLDMTNYDDTQARTEAGQDMTATLPGGYKISYTIKARPVGTQPFRAIVARATPIEPRFAFGVAGYKGIPGKPSLYSQPGGTTLDVDLSNIKVTDPGGVALHSFSFVAADTEDNVGGESFRWTADKPLELLETLYPNATGGCLPANITGLGTTQVTCTGTGSTPRAGSANGVLVSADAPSSFSVRWQTFAQSGIAFGVRTASIQVQKTVVGRYDNTDSFDVSITSPGGSKLATATTGTGDAADTTPVVVIPPNDGSPFTLTDDPTPGSGTDPGNYTSTWICSSGGGNDQDPDLPSGPHASVQVSPTIGDQIRCRVQNVAKTFDTGDAPASYGTTVADGGPRHALSDYDRDTHTASMMLGTQVDTELDGVPSAGVNGDDQAGIDDEDGVAAPILARPGQQTVVDVTVTNNAARIVTLAGWIDADVNGTFDSSELQFAAVPASSGTKTYTLTFPASTATQNTYARFRVLPTPSNNFSQPTGSVIGGETEDYPVKYADPALTITKTSDATASTKPGDTVTYTVSATNSGTDDYTEAKPATIIDDLSDVLDDADFTGSVDVADGAGVDPSYDEPRIRWSGPLAEGKTVTLTYSVVLTGGGDGTVRNVAFAGTGTDPNPPTPTCDDQPVPCAPLTFELPKLTISKSADRADLPAVGEKLTYTVVVRNAGPGVYTVGHPATFTDDLGDVLDDTELIGGPTSNVGTAEVVNGTLRWSGVLGRDGSATITYTVTYNGDGDQRLENSACVPTDEALDPEVRCTSVTTPGSGLVQSKSVDPASGSPVRTGQVLTYTLSFQNGGQSAAAVNTHDDLGRVLDDAELTSSPVAEDGLIASAAGDEIQVTGSVPAGETRTVTYKVTVKSYAEQGDHAIVNALACPPGTPDPCQPATTSNLVKHLTVTKMQTAPEKPNTGNTVDYVVTVTNDGADDYTQDDPAAIVDDLSDVVDDAVYEGGATASRGDVNVNAGAAELTWSGALAKGQEATINYSVTVTNLGDHELRNTVTTEDCNDVECAPAPVVTNLPYVVPKKSSDVDPQSPPGPGDEVTYELSWTNTGLASGTADSTDDLSDVLDDATLTTPPASQDDGLEAEMDGDTLVVTGPVEPGQTVTVTYAVTIKPYGQRGDNALTNSLVADDPQVTCDDGGECTPVDPPRTNTVLGDLRDWKTSDPASGTTVRTGDTLTYTLHFHNTGGSPVDVARIDDLTEVLDDADLIDGPAVSDDALTAARTGARVVVNGTLAAGAEATVTYTVRVQREGGDDRLVNYLLDPDQERPGSCEPDTDEPDCTVNHQSDVVASKHSSAGDNVTEGDHVTYTLTFTNTSADTSAPPVPVDYTDDMSGVLDDATVTSAPQSSVSEVTAEREGDTLHVTGSLSSGETATITYKVRVNNDGDGSLANALVVTGDDVVCADGSNLCTVSKVVDRNDGPDGGNPDDGVLPDTGSTADPWTLLAAFGMVMLGTVLIGTNRRRREG
jgi:uncharacterized repeat protein (TIGR01451 family)/LPXTG-motif cell wall-anchored protein